MHIVTYSTKSEGVNSLDELRETVARLRGPGGCPWDREQTHQSLADCLIEECAELLETIDRLDFDHMREELGDVLLQVVLHAEMASERGRFDLDDVAAEINAKLIRRHPHVFGSMNLETSDEVLSQWERIKAEEAARSGAQEGKRLLKRPPLRLPALLYAREVCKQIQQHESSSEHVGGTKIFDDEDSELTEAEAGGRLFTLVAACRRARIDPESALRRFASSAISEMENEARKQGRA